jgi:hypothetical protein
MSEGAGELSMPTIIRQARQRDAAECGRIIFEAFKTSRINMDFRLTFLRSKPPLEWRPC